MNEQQLREVIAAVVEAVQQVLAEHAAATRPKKALVVFTGGMINFDQSIESLKKLRDSGFDLAVYQSQSSLGIHDRAKIASVGMRPAEDHGLVESYDVLVVPVMTVNMAAKCAHAICDTVPTNLLRGFLQAGKPVVAARDACDPDCPAKAAMFPDMAPGLADVFRENLARLEHIGVTLSSAADLCATTHVVLGCPAPTTPAEQRDSVRATSVEQGSVQPTSVEQPRSGVSKPVASAAVDCPEPVIGVRHIQTLPQGSVLRLTAAHPIITPLAHDCARDRNIRIERA